MSGGRGVTLASPAKAAEVGYRPRASPISLRSRAARTVPDRGRLVKIA